MRNFSHKVKNLKKRRDKQVKKLSKLLSLLVSTEWNMVSESYEENDKTALLASKSVSDASKNVQLAISKLILADFSELQKDTKEKKEPANIQPLKKVVLGKK